MTQALRTIVIGTSLTSASDEVLGAGVTLARATDAAVWLVHAGPPYAVFPPPIYPDAAGNCAGLLEKHQEQLRELMSDQIRRCGLYELAGFAPGQARLTMGSPHREIVDLARRLQADLIVVGATESGHGVLGSTAERVIRKAPCPVLVIRSAAHFPPARVEVPVDLSPISASALRQGMALLVPLGVRPAAIEVLFVLNPFEVGGSIHFEPHQVQRFAEEELERFLLASTSGGPRPGSARVANGYPRKEILAALSERRADLAVIGTHGRSGFERLVLGSVAAGVLRDAECNLLVVPPEASLRRGADWQPGEAREGADWQYVSDEIPTPAGRV